MPDTRPPDNRMKCPVCTASRSQAYVEKDGFSFLKCEVCNFVFCHPRPTQAELAEIYSSSDGEESIRQDYYPKASSRRRRGFMNALKLLPYVWRKRTLDLGCGGGFVAAGFKAVGASTAVGLDISPNAIEYARSHYGKCEFHCGTFEDFSDGAIGKFDFVYSSEVIEHVEDVGAYLQFLTDITEPGGHVFITTPDIASAEVPEDVTQWPVFTPPMHIQFFNQQALALLFDRFGFNFIKRVADPGGAGLKVLFRKS